MTRKKSLKLGYHIEGVGWGSEGWRHPDLPADAGTNFKHIADRVLTAERGMFDYVFIADGVYADTKSMPSVLSHLEPIALLSALAALTSHIGLVGTVSVSYSEPYNVARQFSSLDKISGGRAGWNVVTTGSEGAARNFGESTQISHDERYALATEYLEAAIGLWDSFEPGALVADKEKGIFLDPTKLHALGHKGKYFSIEGALNIDRTPQGRPVIFQAGISDAGRDFATRFADAIFVMPKSFDVALTYATDMKTRVASIGRDPDQLLVLPGITPVVGSTSEEVQRALREQADYIPVHMQLRLLSEYFTGYDFSQHGLDEPFPESIDEKWLNGYRGYTLEVFATAKRKALTLREVARRFGGPIQNFAGTPEEIADIMQHWLERGAADGFMMAEAVPGQLDLFVDHVVPILQKRGLVRRDWEGSTLRDNFGIDFPVNRYCG